MSEESSPYDIPKASDSPRPEVRGGASRAVEVVFAVAGAIMLLLLVSVWSWNRDAKDVEAFCESITSGAEVTTVLDGAARAGFFQDHEGRSVAEEDEVTITNTKGFWGRYACVVKLARGRVAAKRFEAQN